VGKVPALSGGELNAPVLSGKAFAACENRAAEFEYYNKKREGRFYGGRRYLPGSPAAV